MLDKLDTTFAFAKEALEARSYRQGLIASNIANADTPGYKAVDVDFSSTLSSALAHSNQGGVQRGLAGSAENASDLPLVTSDPVHIARSNTIGSDVVRYAQVRYRQPTQPSLDNNAVNLDAERVAFADNAVHYEFDINLASEKQLLSAIQS
ncbi:flagellar basal body rod protein FlgB [Paraburkholderia sp. GAS334]|uniref:flagellar basal body rod protein FlgB n=1 Tax=Paraburkholderia sp. GAS334 TaxID=3035131 RepID=UPI003D1C373B